MITIGQTDYDEMAKPERNPVVACNEADPEDNRTRQEFKRETDINWIIERHGINPFGTKQRPIPLDFRELDSTTGLLEIHLEAANAAHQAWEAWKQLPDNTRLRYRNPEELLQAAEAGRLTLEELGGAPPNPLPPLVANAPKNPPPDPEGG